MNIEQLILRNLLFNEEFLRRVLPFIKKDYFLNKTERIIFDDTVNFVTRYNSAPSIEALQLIVNNKTNLTEGEVDSCQDILEQISVAKDTECKLEWLMHQTEEFCKDKSIYNAILKSITIMDGKDTKHDKGLIPKLLSDALSVSFDNKIGHDYFENSNERFEFYHKKEEKIPFDLDYFNKITKGGVPKKTLNMFMSGVGCGKTLALCHLATNYMQQGKNVLYITLEMSEERIAERIDANLLNVNLDDLVNLTKESYDKKVNKVKSKTVGKLVIKEYPTASASVMHFKALVNELVLKKNFVPDIICIDYLNICTSSRIKPGASINSYTFVKSIAEEIRGLAVELGVPIWSATQVTRGAYGSSDPGMDDVSESFGLPATCDFLMALITSEELESLNQIMVKQIKNRYADISNFKRFVLGIDKAKMRLYNIEQSGQQNIADPGNQNASSNSNQTNYSKIPQKRLFANIKV